MPDQLNIEKLIKDQQDRIIELKSIIAMCNGGIQNALTTIKYLEQSSASASPEQIDFELQARLIEMGNKRIKRLMKKAQK